jgi:dephospho-CoA kinase
VRRVALTGGIATGKSHVRRQFEQAGVPTIDADVLAREAVAPGSPGLGAVVDRFGAGILDATGALNRRALASRVFNDPIARRDLERIVHPAVQRATDDWFAALDPAEHTMALADIPLLYETGRDRDFDAVIVTACDPETQIRRIVERDSLTEIEARQRVSSQLPIEEKVRRADHVVRTDGTYDDTNAQVRKVYEAITRWVAGLPST